MSDSPVKLRLDVAIVAAGLAETRARAQAVIMGGGVAVDGTVVTRPATLVSPSAALKLVVDPNPFVSRGGLKVQRALEAFDIEIENTVVLDVGASTGGFTDALLQAGAARVYAVDVGYGQLAWKLRNDPRVVTMERTNIKNVTVLPEMIDCAVIDVSFISLTQVLPAVKPLLKPNGDLVALVKPQFEAGPRLARKGVVRDPAVWRDVLQRIFSYAQSAGWNACDLDRSPLRGPAGNVEFLIHLSLRPCRNSFDPDQAVGRVQ